MEPPPESADVDFSEVFAGDKIAFNTQKLNYWCACQPRAARAAALSVPFHLAMFAVSLSTAPCLNCAVEYSWPS